MEKMELYNAVREVPAKAQKTITAGRLKGMTDINPMWRIKALTEQFGPCGKGWKYTITNKSLEATTTGEIACFIDIDLYVKFSDGWSEPIPGTGGSMFVAQEKNGLHVSDECFKMALTDAISVACKALGFGADVYWDKDSTKYSKQQKDLEPKPKYICEKCHQPIKSVKSNGKLIEPKQVYEECEHLCIKCYKENKQAKPTEAAGNVYLELNEVLNKYAQQHDVSPDKVLQSALQQCRAKSLDELSEESVSLLCNKIKALIR